MEIVTPSRIHISLIDLNGELGRIDGSVGFGLDDPGFRIKLELWDQIQIQPELDSLTREHILSAAQIMNSLFGIAAQIKVLDSIPPHVGLGSGTQARLAVGSGMAKLAGLDLSIDQLARILRRGGTSGIGIQVFKQGGFILDLGHSIRSKPQFAPSRFSHAPPPPVGFRHPMPNWHVILIIPQIQGPSGEIELEIFRKYCPLPSDQVEKLCRIVLMQLIPALIERDYEIFSQAINSIQRIGFKSIEIKLQHPVVRAILDELKDIALGMSSMGPCLYGLTTTRPELDSVKQAALGILEQHGIPARIICTRPNNFGARIS